MRYIFAAIGDELQRNIWQHGGVNSHSALKLIAQIGDHALGAAGAWPFAAVDQP
ncbi:hypothetical protein [Shewanella sp.]|uniref:hypothetical protein n=1 Tax=Shewanella sp. TaxID=50422 RepID=UPI003A984967